MICLLYAGNLYGQNIFRTDTTFSIDSVWKNDTLFITRTMHLSVIVRDSVSKNKSEKDSIQNKNIRIFEQQNPISYSFFSPSVPNIRNKYSTNKIFLIPFFRLSYSKAFYFPQNSYINNSIKTIGAFELGLNIQKQKKYLDYSCGVNLYSLLEKFSFRQTWADTSISYMQEIRDDSFWHVDTVWILNTDSLLVGDTVYFPYFDSSYIKHIDTLQIAEKKININNKETYKYNSFVILNFPISIGKHVYFDKYSLFVSAGLLTSIILNKKYKIPSQTENTYLPVKFPKVYFSILANCRFEYKFTKKIYFWYGFDLNIPIKSMLKIDDNYKKIYQIGTSCGLKIKL